MMSSLSPMEVLELGSTMYGKALAPIVFAFGRNVGPPVQPNDELYTTHDTRHTLAPVCDRKLMKAGKYYPRTIVLFSGVSAMKPAVKRAKQRFLASEEKRGNHLLRAYLADTGKTPRQGRGC